MYTHILVPIDLAHVAKLEHALSVAGELAKLWTAKITYVAVGSALPGGQGHNPAEFTEHLEGFAATQGAALGLPTAAKPMFSHDPAVDLDHTLLKAVDDLGADLVVMQSHVPGLKDYIWPSNGGRIAGHAKTSVFVVRG